MSNPCRAGLSRCVRHCRYAARLKRDLPGIGEVFEPLRDLALFRQVAVDPEIGTILWPNNADFAADTLYDIGVDLTNNAT